MFAIAMLCLLIACVICDRQRRQLATSERARERAELERNKMEGFLRASFHALTTASSPEAFLDYIAGELTDAVDTLAIRIFELEGDTLKLVAEFGQIPPDPPEECRMGKSATVLHQLHQNELSIRTGHIGEMAVSGTGWILNTPADDPSGLPTFMTVPLSIDNTQRLGVICAIGHRHGGKFDGRDSRLLSSLGSELALAMSLIDANDDLEEKGRLDVELQSAREMQAELLPDVIPFSTRLDIHGTNITARQVSGDFFDIVQLDNDTVLVTIADASGNGIPACMIAAMCRSFVRANATRFRYNLEGLLFELNQHLYAETQPGLFVTVACCLIDKKEGTVDYARGGHGPLLIRHTDGRIEEIKPQGAAVGMLDNELSFGFDTFSFAWPIGTSMLMYTDGISEAENPSAEEFGKNRLIESWSSQKGNSESAIDGIMLDLAEFTQSHPQGDDQTLVVMTRKA